MKPAIMHKLTSFIKGYFPLLIKVRLVADSMTSSLCVKMKMSKPADMILMQGMQNMDGHLAHKSKTKKWIYGPSDHPIYEQLRKFLYYDPLLIKEIKVQECKFHRQKHPTMPRNFGRKISVTNINYWLLDGVLSSLFESLECGEPVSPEWRRVAKSFPSELKNILSFTTNLLYHSILPSFQVNNNVSFPNGFQNQF